MISQLNETPTREEERLISAITNLINFACSNSKELIELEEEMVTSMSRLRELHPQYCILKAQIIEAYTQQVIGVKDEHRN